MNFKKRESGIKVISTPKISIIMAVFNGEKYLHLAIDSVLSQDFRDYEFIIVDDCSNDPTPAIISSYQDERIVYIRNQKNLGQTPSLNIALNVAKGKYIARIDADDMYLQGKLKKQFLFMEEYPEVAVCGTSGIKIDENGDEISIITPPIEHEDILFSIFHATPLIHVSVMMKKVVILECGGYDEKYIYSADLALWSKLLKNNHKIINLPEVLTKYREFGGSVGAINKLGRSGEETIEIIYANILELTDFRISEEQCRDIVFLFYPSSGVSATAICDAHLNLIGIAGQVYHNKIPGRVRIRLIGIFFWSIVKRSIYLRTNNSQGTVRKDLSEIFRKFYLQPAIIILSIFSYAVSFVGEKKLVGLKKIFSNILRKKSFTINNKMCR